MNRVDGISLNPPGDMFENIEERSRFTTFYLPDSLVSQQTMSGLVGY